MSHVTLVNHSSLLFDLGGSQFLTDVWIDSPAFGSWLPVPAPVFHPTYLAALSYEGNARLVISHAHDDHIDDSSLERYWCKAVMTIIPRFRSPSLRRRLERLGFTQVVEIDESIVDIQGVEATAFYQPALSNDDAALAFRDENYCIFHGNDNWFSLGSENLDRLKKFSVGRVLFFASQTNSASGFPLSYPDQADKAELLLAKVRKMLMSGLQNAADAGAKYFLPYAGFSLPFVKGEDYAAQSFFATSDNLRKLIAEETELSRLLLDQFCGGTLDLDSGKVHYPFNFNPNRLKDLTLSYYHHEQTVLKCDSYRTDLGDRVGTEELLDFLAQFGEFCRAYSAKAPEFYPTVLEKSVTFTVVGEKRFSATLQVGAGHVIEGVVAPNKHFEIPAQQFRGILDRKIVLENIYTGFGAKVQRFPASVYNRDIISYLVMFGYKYQRARVSAEAPPRVREAGAS